MKKRKKRQREEEIEKYIFDFVYFQPYAFGVSLNYSIHPRTEFESNRLGCRCYYSAIHYIVNVIFSELRFYFQRIFFLASRITRVYRKANFLNWYWLQQFYISFLNTVLFMFLAFLRLRLKYKSIYTQEHHNYVYKVDIHFECTTVILSYLLSSFFVICFPFTTIHIYGNRRAREFSQKHADISIISMGYISLTSKNISIIIYAFTIEFHSLHNAFSAAISSGTLS